MTKFTIGQLVRFTEYDTFGDSDLFGYVKGYYGKKIGLHHYMIVGYNDTTQIYMRSSRFMKAATQEDEFLLKLVS